MILLAQRDLRLVCAFGLAFAAACADKGEGPQLGRAGSGTGGQGSPSGGAAAAQAGTAPAARAGAGADTAGGGNAGGAAPQNTGGVSAAGSAPAAHGANPRSYPAGAVLRVTDSPYGARGDGTTDDTQALQHAINDVTGTGKIAYLPAGTYLVKGTLSVPSLKANGDQAWGLTNLEGEQEAKVVIQLMDHAPGFDSTSAPKAVLNFGAHGSADWFDNSVRNLTIDTGHGNPGAIALQFFSNNFGGLRDVTLRSGDGAGNIGLDLGYNDMNGPLLAEYLTVSGFQFGVRLANAVNSATFEHVTLSGQSDTAFFNDGQAVSMRGLTTSGGARSIFNGGVMTLLDSSLSGAAPAAIHNEGVLFARALNTSGYASAIEAAAGAGPPAPGPHIDEYTSGPTLRLFSDKTKSLSLPIQETPEIPWDDPATWVSVVDKGADPSGGADSAAAIQAAIDAGATTVYFPLGSYTISQPIVLRGNVRRLLGMHSNLDYNGDITPDLTVADGVEPVVAIDRLNVGSVLELATTRAVVLLDSSLNEVKSSGSGDVFIEDVTTSPWAGWTFGKQRVWARQINPENDGTHILNGGGTLWVLGLKTERGGTLIDTEAAGKTELLGGFSYTTTDPLTRPMFINNGSQFSATFAEVSFGPPRFNPLVSETVGGATKLLRPSDGVPDWVNGSALPLYVGY